MIFVTVGTDHHPFDRLFAWLEEASQVPDLTEPSERIIAQHGYTKVTSDRVECHEFLPFEDMVRYFREADVVVTHGSSTAILVCHEGKRPIVVPREHGYGEHIDDHQVEFLDHGTAVYPLAIARTKHAFFRWLRNRAELMSLPTDFVTERKRAQRKFAEEFQRVIYRESSR